MKYLTDRQEIAQAMNFRKYPVLRIDVETPKTGWDDVYEGDFVRVEPTADGRPDRTIRARLEKYPEDGGKYSIMPAPVCLRSDFGYSSVIESLNYAQAPVIHAGETVVVIEDYPKQRICKVHMMRVSDRIREHVFPTCELIEIE